MAGAAANGSSGGEFFENPVANDAAASFEQEAVPASFEQESKGQPDNRSGTAPRPQRDTNEAVADLEHTLTDDELSDLTFAFQALDINRNGTIEPRELHAMMAVLGAQVELEVVRELFQRTMAEFHAWQTLHEDKLLPDEMNYSNKKETQRARLHINIPWMNKVSNQNVIAVAIKGTRNPIVSPVVTKIGSTADELLNLSSALVRGAASQIGLGETAAERAERIAMRDLENDPDSMIFAEYTHMMESRFLLEELVPGDWHKRAGRMRELRRAFDMADVNGNDAVDFDEFEMVLTSLNPLHGLSHDDVLYLWELMMAEAPQEARSPGKAANTMNFLQYLHGMAVAAKDAKAAGWLDIEQPNKWELLSLIVDTPVSAAEERSLLENLSAIERMGIKMLQNDQEPMDKEHMRAVLKRAGNGDLRRLSPEQVSRMHSLKLTGWLAAGLIGFVMTIVPCLVENYLVAELGVDGVKDRFDVCQPFSVIRWDGNSSETGEPSATMTYPTQAIRENWGYLQCQVRPMNGSRDTRTLDDVGEWYDSMQIQPSANYYDWAVYYDAETVADRAVCLPGSRWSGSGDKLSLCESCECEVCQCFHHSDGQVGGEADVATNPILRFWLILVVAIGLNVVGEIILLMRVAVRYCTKVAWALDQRLVPLNADRAFVADSLVRAAFELGNPNTAVLGVDPQTEERSKLKLLTLVLLYKAKVVLLGFLLKQIVAFTTPAGFATYAMPWVGTCGGTVFWDALIAACILLQVSQAFSSLQ